MYRQSVGKIAEPLSVLFALRCVKPAFIFRKSTKEKRIPRRTIIYPEAEDFAGFSVAAVQVPRQKELDAGGRAIPSSRDRCPADVIYYTKVQKIPYR